MRTLWTNRELTNEQIQSQVQEGLDDGPVEASFDFVGDYEALQWQPL